MNDSQIENLLRQPPCPSPPPGLLKQLQADIVLPSQGRHAGESAIRRQNFLRRWFPSLAFGVFLLSCVVIIGVQSNLISQIKRQNQDLRAATSDLEQLRKARLESQRLQTQFAEVEQLRKQSKDLVRLRTEIAQLRREVGELEQLQSENARLKLAGSAGATAADSQAPKTNGQSEECGNNLKQIGLAVRVWALDNEDRFPTDIISCSNELSTPNILICPSDAARQQFKNIGWNQFGPAMISYELTNLSGKDESRTPDHVIAKCPLHQNVLFSDGHVQEPAKAARQDSGVGERGADKPAP